MKRIEHKIHLAVILTLALVCLILPQAVAMAATYYVSSNGNDNNLGIIGQPWKTIQKAASTIVAGDTCIVLSGNYAESVYISKSGNAGAPIVYQASDNVVLNGSFNINAAYIHVSGFELVSGGIFVNGDYCQVLDNYVHDRTGNVGIGAYGRYGTIRGNTIVRAVECGIKVNGQNNLIENNDISHSLTQPPDKSYTTDADGIRFFGTGHTFRRNYIHHIMHSETGGDPHIDGFQTWGPASNIIFEKNLYLSVDTSLSNQIVQISNLNNTEVKNLTFKNNIFVMNDPGWSSMTFYYVDGSPSFIENISIVNNTFVHPNGTGAGGIWLRGVKNATIKNNIFYDYCDRSSNYVNFYADQPSTNIIIGNNCTYNSSGVYPNSGPYPNDLWMTNPDFVNFENMDFHLQSTSPCIDKAETLSTVTDDYDGNPRPKGSAPDIGAYETSSTVDPSPKLSVNPTSYDFGSTGLSLAITIKNTGGGTLSWNSGESLDWLSLNKTSGSLGAGSSENVTATVSRSAKSPGTYSGTISFTSNGGNQDVSVTMTVPQSAPVLSVSPASHDFGMSQTSYQFTVRNTGEGTLSWNAGESLDWLSLNKTSGSLGAGSSENVTTTVSRSGKSPGTYNGKISFTSNGGNQDVSVTMAVPDSDPALSVSPTLHDFATSETSDQFIVNNIGGGTLSWNASENISWLSLDTTSGSLSSWRSQSVTATVDRTGLSSGSYYGIISFTSSYGNQDVEVYMSVPESLDSDPYLSVIPTSHDFGTSETSRQFRLINIGGGTLNWFTSVNISWLRLYNTNGILSAGQLAYTTAIVDRTGLSAGTYYGSIYFIATYGTETDVRTVSVQMTVAGSPPKLLLTPASYDFGTTGTSLTITVNNTGEETLNWNAGESLDWLSLNKTSGSLGAGISENVIATVSRSAKSPGTYNGTISFTSNGGNQDVSVTMTVTEPAPALSVSPVSHDFGTSETSYQFTVKNTGAGTLSWNASESLDWLSLNKTSGSLGAGISENVTATVSRSAKSPGTYNGTISFTSNGGSQDVAATITVRTVRTDYVGYWKFETSSGGVTPDETGISNGILKGNASIIKDKEKGNVLSLDGNGDYVDCGNDSILKITDAITVSAWVKPREVSQSDKFIISRRGSYFLDGMRSWSDADKPHFYVYNDSGGSDSATSSSKLDVNIWTHVAGTYDGKTIRIYIN